MMRLANGSSLRGGLLLRRERPRNGKMKIKKLGSGEMRTWSILMDFEFLKVSTI
jgi:hypothetical protein